MPALVAMCKCELVNVTNVFLTLTEPVSVNLHSYMKFVLNYDCMESASTDFHTIRMHAVPKVPDIPLHVCLLNILAEYAFSDR